MLHGRDAVISVMRRWLAGVGRGAGGAVHLVGVAGVGKTATLEMVADLAVSKGMRVLRVFGYPEESDVAWSGLSQLVIPFLSSLDQFDERPRQVLLRTLRLSDDGDVDDVSIGMAVLLLLTRSDEPITVLIDDVQWLDPESSRVLSFVARRLNATGVGFLSAGHLDSAIIGQPVELDTLDDAALRAIARDRGVAAAVAEVIAKQAEGLPLVLAQIIAGLDDDQRSGRRPLPEPVAEIARIDRALATRIAALPTDSRTMLAATALAPWADVETIAGFLDIDDHATVIAPAIDAGLVTIAGGRLDFAHPTIRTAAAQVSPEERRRLHELLARIADLRHRGWHLAAAADGPDDVAAHALDELADDAERRGANLAALRARQTAIDVAESPDRGRVIAAAWNAIRARLPDVADTLVGTLDDPDSADVRALTAEAAWVRGDVATAREQWVTLADDAHTPMELVESSRRKAARASFRMYDTPSVHRLASGATDDPQLHLVELGADAIRGRASATEQLVTHAEALLVDNPSADSIATLAEVVTLALARTGHAEALAALSERIGDLANERVPHLVPALLISRAAHLSRSDLIGGGALARDAVALSEEWDRLEHRPFALAIAAIAEASSGGPDAMSLIEGIRAYPVPVAQAVATYAEALVHYGLGDNESARDLLMPAHEEHPTESSFGFMWHADLVDIALRLDDRALAERVAEDLRTVLDTTNNPWVKAATRRVDGLLATDRDMADHAFTAAIEGFSDHGYKITAARCRLDWVGRLRRDRRRSVARAQIQAARPALLAGGARPWVERCDVEAGALGLSVPEPTVAAAAALLTPRELQVARWLIGGLTFKQIGARLFLSHRTVEAHGQSVYRKLGVRGRAELAQLSQHDPSLAPPTA